MDRLIEFLGDEDTDTCTAGPSFIGRETGTMVHTCIFMLPHFCVVTHLKCVKPFCQPSLQRGRSLSRLQKGPPQDVASEAPVQGLVLGPSTVIDDVDRRLDTVGEPIVATPGVTPTPVLVVERENNRPLPVFTLLLARFMSHFLLGWRCGSMSDPFL